MEQYFPAPGPTKTEFDTLSNTADAYFGSSKSWIANAELNNYKTTGIYCIGSGATVGGVANGECSWSILSVIAGRNDTVVQTVYGSSGIKFLTRQYRNNAWSAFFSPYDQIENKIVYAQSSSAITKNGGTGIIDYPTGYNRTNCAPVYAMLYVNASGPRYFDDNAFATTLSDNGIHVVNKGGADGYIIVGLTKLVIAT